MRGASDGEPKIQSPMELNLKKNMIKSPSVGEIFMSCKNHGLDPPKTGIGMNDSFFAGFFFGSPNHQ